jgi:acyl dehydratase
MSDEAGKISDADIERQRRQIGVSQYQRDVAHVSVVSEDAIRNFAFGMLGDDNPLWHDAAYGKRTRWRGMIAPPLFACATGVNETQPYETPEQKALFKGLYRGVGRYNAGTEWRLFRPLRPGDQLYHDYCVASVDVKERSAFSGGRTVVERIQQLYMSKDGEPVAVRLEKFINAERAGSKETGKHTGVQRHVYDNAEIAEIDRLYAAEERRGANPRYWEDVKVGDEIGAMVKGPISVFEIICAHIGWGVNHFGGYAQGPLRWGWKTRQKLKAFYSDDKYGIPSSMFRLHWDQEAAETLGLPASYDYGQMRSQWASQAVVNWMGDDAWMSAIETDIRTFNFHGDTTVLNGCVIDKHVEDERYLAELKIEGVNQRGETNVSAKATVVLPSQKGGPVLLPKPDDALAQRGARLMSEAAAYERKKSHRE